MKKLFLLAAFSAPALAQTPNPDKPKPPVARTIPRPLAGHPGNVFLRGENVEIEIKAPGAAWTCVDYEQKTVANGTGETAKLGPLPVGYYEVWATDAGGKRLNKSTLAVLEPLQAPTPFSSPIGIDMASAWFYNPQGGNPATIKEAANHAALAGMNRVRDRLTWAQTETQRGQFAEKTFYDETARAQNEAGLQVLQVFHSTPQWAAENTNRFPNDLRDVYNYLKTMSARWRGKVQAWEPWNEADIPGFGGHSGLEMASYQKAAYWGLRAGNPDAIVCQNVFAHPTRTGIFENFLENNPQAYYDTFNFHHYYGTEDYPRLYKVMSEATTLKPMWVSEAGTHIPWDGDEKAQEPTWENQQKQARFVTQCFAASISEGSDATFFFLLPHYTEGKTQFGLMHRDLTPRPGYLALAAAGRLLAGATPIKRPAFTMPQGSPLRVFAFRSVPGGKPQTVVVAWSQNGKVAAPLPGGFQAYDFLGRPLKMTTPEIGTDPVYLVYPVDDRPSGEQRSARFVAPRFWEPCALVLQALLPPDRIRLSDSSYRLARGETFEAPVFVYNFGKAPMKTKLKVTAPPALQVEVPHEEFTIAPLERREVRLRVRQTGAPMGVEPLLVKITAPSGASQAIAAVRFMLPLEEITPVNSLAIKSATQPENWRKNQSAGEQKIEASEGGVAIDSQLQPGDRWVYPILVPAAPELPKGDFDGIAFTVVPLQGQADYRLQFDEANGSSYISDADVPKPQQMNKPYRVVVLFNRCSWGSWSKADDNGKLDSANITGIKMGLNTKDAQVRYIIRDVSWVKYAK